MKRNFVCKACGIVVTVSLLLPLTGCAGSGNTDATKDALLATETTAATEATKATTPKPTKPSTTKTTKPTGKTDATKPSEPAATQKPAETPKPTNPPATEAPKPTNPPATNPPATEAPKPTNPPATQPPATEAPKPTDPPETEPPVVSLSCSEAIEYGRSYISSLGAILTPGLSNEYCGYFPASFVCASSQDELDSKTVSVIDANLVNLEALNERNGDSFNVADYRLDVYVEWDGDNGYYITVYYG